MAKTFGFGLVGCGLASEFHCKGITASPNARLAAVVDQDAGRAAKVASEYGCEAAKDLDALLARKDVDIVNVLTPNALHEQIVIPCLRAKKHVIVEKPPEMTLAATDRMIAEAEKNGVKLAVCLQVRFRKPIEAIRKAIEQGRFGRILEGDAIMKWFRPREYYFRDPWRSRRSEGGGIIIQIVFHYYDALMHLVGPIRRVWARTRNLMHPAADLEDTVVAFLDFANGAQGVVHASTAFYPGTDVRIEINGEKGTAIMSGERIVAWEFDQEMPEDQEIRQIGSAAAQTAAVDAGMMFYEHMWLIQDMCDAIENDREPRVTAADARRTLEVALAMYKSADEGRPVELPLKEDYRL